MIYRPRDMIPIKLLKTPNILGSNETNSVELYLCFEGYLLRIDQVTRLARDFSRGVLYRSIFRVPHQPAHLERDVMTLKKKQPFMVVLPGHPLPFDYFVFLTTLQD